MQPSLFFLYTGLSVLAAAPAFFPRHTKTPPPRSKRFWLYIATIAAISPLVIKIIFTLHPILEARLIPLGFYALIDREYTLPFQVLFFAFASQLVATRERRAVIVFTLILIANTAYQTSWRLTRPAAYDSTHTTVGFVCQQSSDYTCAAASAVSLLSALNISSTEGEMTRLISIIPERGATNFNTALGLRDKLQQSHPAAEVTLQTPPPDQLQTLPSPFLACIRYSILFDHMICVLQVDDHFVTIADPLIGLERIARDEFAKKWRGVAIVPQLIPVTATR